MSNIPDRINNGDIHLGIEFGSTRIKAVLIDNDFNVVASGNFVWENTLENNYWTYSINSIWEGLQKCYLDLKENVKKMHRVTIKKIKNIGISGMMHGYLVFDVKDEVLVPFRTWRNNLQEEAAKELTEKFNYPVPQRFSVAHIYQAILNKEEHVNKIRSQATLASFVHYKLTNERVIGIGEASGMFAIDIDSKNYDENMLKEFNKLISSKGVTWKYEDILPKVLIAGEKAGKLTKEGAKLLDPSGDLLDGAMFCPPEGDAGTGMVATNSISPRTGNVSAGTSVFAMIVLEQKLKKIHEELDLVTTPEGNLVAMVHSNNCTSNLNSWIELFDEVIDTLGFSVSKDDLYTKLYTKALLGDLDCGGLLSIGYVSGEHITGFEEGRPIFINKPNSRFNLANFMRVNLYTSLGALKIGLEILKNHENVNIDAICGHGGFFKTKDVGQKIMASATGVKVSVLENAGEGGAWGMALLASYLDSADVSLKKYLNKAFKNNKIYTVEPSKDEIEGFDKFMEIYKAGLEIERSAILNLK